MEASIVDLRYKAKEVINALERNERVDITYRGIPKGVIHPVKKQIKKDVRSHAFFGMNSDKSSVEETMNTLRGVRT